MEALNTGQTNITRALTILMQNPAQWQGNVTDIAVDPRLSDWLKQQFGAPGRMTPPEIGHIDTHWPMADKRNLREEVVKAINAGRPMIFRWTLTSQPAAQTDVVWPPAGAPLTVPVLVTFHSASAGVTFSPANQGTVDVAV